MDEIDKFFNKKVGELLEQLEVAGCEPNQKFAAKRKFWSIVDEIKVKFELKVKIQNENTSK